MFLYPNYKSETKARDRVVSDAFVESAIGEVHVDVTGNKNKSFFV